MRRLIPVQVLLAVTMFVAGCTPVATPPADAAQAAAPQGAGAAGAETATLNVFAAASLTDAFNEIGKNFADAHPGTEMVFNYAGSNQLATQIGQGAPADVFASANKTQMKTAIDAGRIISGTERTFARNRLVAVTPAVTPANNPAGIKTLQDLAKPGLKLVFAAKEVPVGQYALDFLEKAAADPAFGPEYRDAVLANVASYEENVRAVLTKVALGEADAGIVYTSDVVTVEPGKIVQIDIPDNLNTIATYPIAALQDSPHPELAQQFIDYVLAPEGQQILVKYGFMAPASPH